MTAEIEFGELDEFLMSDRAPEDCMQLSDLDGFLTGIAVSPDMILPSEWLPVIWGGGEPEFDGAGEAQRIFGLILLRYNAILTALATRPDRYRPILWGTPDGRMIAGDWADGFFAAIALRRASWTALFESEHFRLMAPIAAFWSDEDGHPIAPGGADHVAEIQDMMLDRIPEAVVAVHRFWNQRRTDASPTLPRARFRPAAKVGRNDACPCGSGRKYKKCCGAH